MGANNEVYLPECLKHVSDAGTVSKAFHFERFAHEDSDGILQYII